MQLLIKLVMMASFSSLDLRVLHGGCLLSICLEFLTDRRQRVVVDGAYSEWIPIVSGVPQSSVLYPLLFILYTSEMLILLRIDCSPMLMTLHCLLSFVGHLTGLL